MLLQDEALVFTRHAERRAKARGWPWRIVSLICANADRRTHVGGGCLSLMVSKSELEALAGLIPAEDRERMKGVAVVLDPATETVVTVLHIRGRRGGRYRRQRSGRGRRAPPGQYAPASPELLSP